MSKLVEGEREGKKRVERKRCKHILLHHLEILYLLLVTEEKKKKKRERERE